MYFVEANHNQFKIHMPMTPVPFYKTVKSHVEEADLKDCRIHVLIQK